MGVRDLVPFVKKVAPSCITPYPSLHSFTGSRFAIDANLLTTKFHFANVYNGMSTRDNVIQQWYQFLQALEKLKIQPIVVFDGETRVKEKERENERRRKTRELERLRGQAESARAERLKKLREVWSGVGTEDRAAVVKGMREALERRKEGVAEAKVEPAQPRETVDTLVEGMRETLEQRQEGAAEATVEAALPHETVDTLVEGMRETLEQRQEGVAEATAEAEAEAAQPHETVETLVEGMREALEQRQEGAAEATVEVALPLETVQTLLHLYDNFRSDEANPIYSRNQILVTGEEDAVFQKILAKEVVDASPTIGLEDVIARSEELGATYVARSASVQRETHLAVQELVDALGVPFVVPSPSEPHEAEGLCASLYSLGLADYVVSEDTDVAVYGAPLLRQISTVDEEHRNMIRKDGRLKESMAVLDPVKLKNDLGLTKEEFVDFALLCGTDFTERIPLLGPVKAFDLIRKHSTIEAILAHYPDKYRPGGDDPSAYLQTIRDARAIFLSLPPLPFSPPASPTSSAANDVANSPSPTPSSQPPDDALAAFLSPRPTSPDLAAILEKYGIVPTAPVAETNTAAPVWAALESSEVAIGEAVVEEVVTGERVDLGVSEVVTAERVDLGVSGLGLSELGVSANRWMKKNESVPRRRRTGLKRGGDRTRSSVAGLGRQAFL
ncbi:hypothetical protein JCM5296_005223 [Sporobolomyces johnsonii]